MISWVARAEGRDGGGGVRGVAGGVVAGSVGAHGGRRGEVLVHERERGGQGGGDGGVRGVHAAGAGAGATDGDGQGNRDEYSGCGVQEAWQPQNRG